MGNWSLNWEVLIPSFALLVLLGVVGFVIKYRSVSISGSTLLVFSFFSSRRIPIDDIVSMDYKIDTGPSPNQGVEVTMRDGTKYFVWTMNPNSLLKIVPEIYLLNKSIVVSERLQKYSQKGSFPEYVSFVGSSS